MNELEPKPTPAKLAPDDEPEGPCWWERAVWSVGCGCVALAVGFGLLYLGLGVTEYFKPQRGWDILGLFFCLVWEIPYAGGFGLIAGALYPGRIGLAATLAAQGVFCLLVIVGLGSQFDILSLFFLAAAVLLGAIAFALWRLTGATPNEAALEKKPLPDEGW